MKVDSRQAVQIDAIVAKLVAKRTGALSLSWDPLRPVWQYLQSCEQVLILFMFNKDPTADSHTLEWGLVLYILNNPEKFGLSVTIEKGLKLLGMPGSQITDTDWATWEQTLETDGIVCGDGSIIATTKWNALDPGWTLAFVSYAYYYLAPDEIATFGPPPKPVSLKPADPNTLVVVLISDWGTGAWTDGSTKGPAQAVLAAIKSLKPGPDVVIHLGDTYYAGFDTEVSDNLTGPIRGLAPQMFTLNANHEMYNGANGYFGTALAAGGPFSLQKGTSYFALTYGNTIIIGLDTAYYDTSLLYLDGALTDPAQIGFIRGLDLTGKTVIVMTHHNPLDITGANRTPLWQQVATPLGRDPDYWFWGHLHDGIVYSSASAAGTTKARCVGHAALPFGNASILAKNGTPIETVSYYAHTPLDPNPYPDLTNRVLNGFAVLNISSAGVVSEKFYNQNSRVEWSSPGYTSGMGSRR